MQGLKRNCILCSGADSQVVYRLDDYSLLKCLNCGLVYIDHLPQKKQEINERLYSSEEFKKRYFKGKLFLKRWFNGKLKNIEKLMPGKGRVLDIGCSYGFFLEAAQKRGWDIYGVEMNPIAGDYLSGKFGDKVFIGRLEDSGFHPNFFDVITLWDVLEHIDNPLQFLGKCKALLKKGGFICIQAPNIDSFIARKKGKDWDWLNPGDHLYYFNPSTLAKLIEAVGLDVVKVATWQPVEYFIDSLFGFYERRGLPFIVYRKTVLRVLRRLLFFIFLPFQRLAIGKDGGAEIILIAKSPKE